jgi:ribosome maturation factor RimP
LSGGVGLVGIRRANPDHDARELSVAGSELPSRVERILAPSLEAMGYEIVRVQLSGGRSPTLQVMVERRDGAAILVDDCAAVSRTASALLDVEDPLHGSYTLEVSSPGIDRPLVKPKDFERYAGHEVKIETGEPVLLPGGTRRRFRGKLLGIEEGKVKLAMPDGAAELPLAAIQKARLVLTDELLAAAASGRGAAQEGRG